MKRTLVSLLLALALVLAALPGMTLAAEEAPVEITWAGTGTTLFPNEESLIVQELNKRFNIKLIPVPVNCGSSQEMTLLFASGIVPDHMQVIPASIAKYMDEGIIRPIPYEQLQEYPALYDMVMTNQPFVQNLPVYQDGQLYGIPTGDQPLLPMTMVRTDWLEAVGLTMPANLEEFEEMCRRFTEEDPDGNGVNDTYAMDINGPSFYYVFAAFGVTPYVTYVADDQWILDENGNAVKATVSAEYKDALRFIAGLNAKGYLHPDAAATAADKNAFFTNGITGMMTAAFNQFIINYSPNGPYALLFANNPDAACDYLSALKGLEGQEPAFGQNRSVWRYGCFGYKASDEAVAKILEIYDAQIVDVEVGNLIWRGVEDEHFTVDETGMAIIRPEYSSAEKQAELGCKFFIINSRNADQMMLSYGQERLNQEALQKDWTYLPLLLAPGVTWEAQTQYSADCKAIEEEFFYNVVTGVWDVDKEWDGYINRWNTAGGLDIIAGANALIVK